MKEYIDRPWIAVDTTTGPHRGRFYCIGQISEPIIYTSIDGATTFAPPLTPHVGRELANCRPANPAIMPDGGVLFVYQDRYVEKSSRRGHGESWPRPRIETLRSTDGGRPGGHVPSRPPQVFREFRGGRESLAKEMCVY